MAWGSESWRDWIAGVAATLLLTVAAWWKARLIVRRDGREDHGEQRVHDANEQIIDTLREEVARLAASVEAMSVRIDTETRLRYEAQAEAASLRLRVTGLEIELRELRGTA